MLGVAQFGVFGAGRFNQRGIFGHVGRNGLAEKQGGLLRILIGEHQPALGIEHVVDAFDAARGAGLVEQLEGVFVGLGSRQALRIAFGFGAAVVQIIERKLAEFGGAGGLRQGCGQIVAE